MGELGAVVVPELIQLLDVLHRPHGVIQELVGEGGRVLGGKLELAMGAGDMEKAAALGDVDALGVLVLVLGVDAGIATGCVFPGGGSVWSGVLLRAAGVGGSCSTRCRVSGGVRSSGVDRRIGDPEFRVGGEILALRGRRGD